jgi:hypothetical protein
VQDIFWVAEFAAVEGLPWKSECLRKKLTFDEVYAEVAPIQQFFIIKFEYGCPAILMDRGSVS